jgi:cobalamin biosynthesis Mg chelatase CobN
MRRIRTGLPALALTATLALVSAPAAYAGAFEDIFADYAKTGKVDACRYSAGKIKQAQGQVPNDIEQYAPDFPAALDAAADKRANGGCDKAASTKKGAAQTTTQPAAPSASTTTPATSTAAPTTPTTPAAAAPPSPPNTTPQPAPDPVAAPAAQDNAIPAAAASSPADTGSDNAPAPLLLLAILGGLLALGALVYGAARWWAFDPPWLVRWRHATAEAGWRASNAWAEFTDWVKLGR